MGPEEREEADEGPSSSATVHVDNPSHSGSKCNPTVTLNVHTFCNQKFLSWDMAKRGCTSCRGKQAQGLQRLQGFNPSQKSQEVMCRLRIQWAPDGPPKKQFIMQRHHWQILKTCTKGEKKEMICRTISCLWISKTQKYKICIFPGMYICEKKNPYN